MPATESLHLVDLQEVLRARMPHPAVHRVHCANPVLGAFLQVVSPRFESVFYRLLVVNTVDEFNYLRFHDRLHTYPSPCKGIPKPTELPEQSGVTPYEQPKE